MAVVSELQFRFDVGKTLEVNSKTLVLLGEITAAVVGYAIVPFPMLANDEFISVDVGRIVELALTEENDVMSCKCEGRRKGSVAFEGT